MLVYLVHIHVKSQNVDEFIEATIKNAKNSVNEPGIIRFDIIQQQEDPNRFVLVEVYKSVEATVSHKETSHYLEWRDTVTNMIVEPRQGVKYWSVFPKEVGWE